MTVDPPDLVVHEQSPLEFVPGPDALESAGGDGIFNSDGTVNMVIIRPCHGRGMYNNIYEADMLKREAPKFAGIGMFDNHESPVARKARMGIPRPVSELAGAVRESWWDPEYTGDDDEKYGYEKGAVVGKCALTDTMEALVRKIPEVVKGSLNTQATNKRQGQRNGRKGWIVEGFESDPENSSFDLVTKAGAGGRVASVLEAAYADASDAPGLADALQKVTDDELVAHLREHRPGVLESQGDDQMGMTLREALQSDEVKTFIAEQVDQQVTTRVRESAVDTDALRQDIRDELAAGTRLRGLAAHALGVIENARIPELAKTKLKAEYGLTEHDDDTVTAGRSLGVIEAVIDDSGAVTKTAKSVLDEVLEADIKAYRDMFATANPTVPRAPVTSTGGSGDGSEDGTEVQESAWETRLKRRGLDPSQFGGHKPATPAGAAQ